MVHWRKNWIRIRYDTRSAFMQSDTTQNAAAFCIVLCAYRKVCAFFVHNSGEQNASAIWNPKEQRMQKRTLIRHRPETDCAKVELWKTNASRRSSAARTSFSTSSQFRMTSDKGRRCNCQQRDMGNGVEILSRLLASDPQPLLWSSLESGIVPFTFCS